MKFSLPKLAYAKDSLEPYIDATTMDIHYEKHHAGYVAKLNAALENIDTQGKSIEDILGSLDSLPEEVRPAVRNNGGGHANHSLFWSILAGEKSDSEKNISGKSIEGAINTAFGSFEAFKKSFTDAALTRFGSGWAWLVVKDGSLVVTSTPNQDSPLMKHACCCSNSDESSTSIPILGLDVWEHAYYLNYQNRRPDYVDAFFNVISWDVVDQLYKNAQ